MSKEWCSSGLQRGAQGRMTTSGRTRRPSPASDSKARAPRCYPTRAGSSSRAPHPQALRAAPVSPPSRPLTSAVLQVLPEELWSLICPIRLPGPAQGASLQTDAQTPPIKDLRTVHTFTRPAGPIHLGSLLSSIFPGL